MASSILARLAVLISGDSAGLDKSLKQSEKQLTGFSKAVKGVGGELTAALGAIGFVALGKQILDITAEFQKFEAVLTNTLGSKSAAQDAMERIQDFAAKTPFSVQELTASFVKLANQGFVPTTDELRKLGDLASSTGKNFDQLSEAILDAQTGEFERLKEFGIRASKQGDQVTFAFKGVETQTKFTADSIREYILTLGDLQGVSGSMAAISETLGGKISNLGDAWDKFLLSLGTQTSGVAFTVLDLLSRGVEGAIDALTDDKGLSPVMEELSAKFVEGADSAEEITATIAKLKVFQAQTAAESANLATKTGETAEEMKELEKKFSLAREYTAGYGAVIEILTKKLDDLKKKTEEVSAAPRLSIIESLNAEIKRFEELKNKSFSIEEISGFNNKLKELKDTLELINLAGSESGFLKNLNAGVPQSPTDPSQTRNPLEGAFPTTLPVPDSAELVNGLLSVEAVKAELAAKEALRFEDDIARHEARVAMQEQQAAAAQEYGGIIGDAFGQAASGQITFAQAAKRATADIVKTLLARAMAGIIASAATAGGPPPVAIALAAAGVAAIGALFAKFVGGSGGASGGGGANTPASRASSVTRNNPLSRPEDRIEFDAKFEIEGTKLVAVTNNTNVRSQRTG